MSTTWFVPRTDLSPYQLRAVELHPGEHHLILGAPGCGKTIVLLHRARHLIDTYNVDPRRLRIFVFTNTLKDYIRSAMDFLKLPEGCVITFDHWCIEFYTTVISQQVPLLTKQGPDYDAIRGTVLAKLRDHAKADAVLSTITGPIRNSLQGSELEKAITPWPGELIAFMSWAVRSSMYEVVLVDEGQDLTQDAYEILKLITRHVTVCMDARQQIYDRRCDEQTILSILGLAKRNLTILGTYRCCPYINKLAATFIRDPEEKSAFLNQAKTKQQERLTPYLYIADNTVQEKAKLVEFIRARQLTGDRIAVLLPSNAQLYSLANFLKAKGLEVEVPDKDFEPDFHTHDFQSELPKLMTYYGAKGMTFDTVLMPRLVRSSFMQFKPERLENLLFVGITRATRWVYMSTIERSMPLAVARLANLEGEEAFTVERQSPLLPGLFSKAKPIKPQQPIEPVPVSDPLTEIF